MKYLPALVLCAATAAHAGIPVTGGPAWSQLPPDQLLQAQQQLAAMQKVRQAAVRNDAVRVLPDGRRVVEEPPGPKARPKLPTLPSQWSQGHRAHSYVIDTTSGLKECGWPWVAQGCRDYVPGRDRRERSWVVKHGRQWLKCPRRDSAAGCVDYYQPGMGAVQE